MQAEGCERSPAASDLLLFSDYDRPLRRRVEDTLQERNVALGCLFLAAAAGAVLAGGDLANGLALVILMGCFALVAVKTERARWGQIGLISPLALYGVSWFLYFGVFGVGAFDARYPIALRPEQILVAMAVGLGSLLLITIGYRVATAGLASTSQRFVGDATQPISSASAVYACLALGWAARLYRFETGTFGYLGFGNQSGGLVYRIISLTDGLLIVALVILAMAAWSHNGDPSITRRGARILLAINIMPLIVLTGVASGVKGQLITDLMPVGLMFIILKNRLPWKVILLIFVYLLLLYSGAERFRADIASGVVVSDERHGLIPAASAAFERIAASWTTESPERHVQDLWQGITTEYAATPSNLALIIDQTPRFVPFIGVKRLFTAPLFFVPYRYLGDPHSNIGGYFAQRYLNDYNSSVFPTQPGDLFMSGGWAAVAAGEIAVGILLGLVWRLIVLRKLSARSMILYIVLASQFFNAGLDWGSLSRGTLQYIIFYGAILTLLLRESPLTAIWRPTRSRSSLFARA